MDLFSDEAQRERVGEEEVRSLEAKIGFSFPPAYRKFLLENNGGPTKPFAFKWNDGDGDYADSVLRCLLAIHGNPAEYWDQFDYHLRMFGDRIPSHMAPIGVDPFGNLVLISLDGEDAGKIYFWDHENEVEEGEVPESAPCSGRLRSIPCGPRSDRSRLSRPGDLLPSNKTSTDAKTVKL